ncbi:MAG: S9 family peptidase [Gemmatimonadetes bacterium]|nr:S9 family peptidase [Gemmatimonadota bacterium]
MPRLAGLAALAILAGCTPAAMSAPGAAPSPAERAAAAERAAVAAAERDLPRAGRLYVSTNPQDHPQMDFAADAREKAATDSTYAARAAGVLRFEKINYPSSVDGMPVPAYLFAPLSPRGPRAHAAMVWVHGGVHGDWDVGMWPFVREAVAKGYVIIAPEYRGSTGHGAAHYNAVDYGGKEVDDVRSAVGVLAALPYVDPERIGMMGWSHGGYITSLISFRSNAPVKAAVAMVPVTNLVFRLSYKGPGYQRMFATQSGIGGLPFERQAEYIRRSPLYHVDSLRIPFLVHVATNDTDVDYVEDRQMVDALRARKPELAETKIYVDPPVGAAGGGHTFNRRFNPVTLERDDSPEQVDSWNLVWAFFARHLRP